MGPARASILDGGWLGPLVPPGDAAALAAAMARTWDAPLPVDTLRQGGARYEAQRNADLYLNLMLGDRGAGDGG